jgi:superoxide reductase
MAEVKFYRCNHCGNIVVVVKDAGVTPMCCGEKMELLVAGATDAAVEKHVPVVTVEGEDVTARVGAVDHPMLDVHYIEWIAVQTKYGNQRKALHPGEAPKACFALCAGDEVEAVYAYCNLHSLWKA